MIILSSTDSIQIVTATGGDCDVVASWIDDLAGVITPGRTVTAITTATTTVNCVPAPASSTYRNVKSLMIQNKDGALSQTVTVQMLVTATAYNLIIATLQINETLMYFDQDGWVIMDASGGIKTAAATGRFIRTTVLTTAVSFTTSAATNTLRVRMVGAGGGGGGATSNASNISAAGGGASGGYAEKTFTVTPSTAYTYQIGAGGPGGINGANAGNNGTNTFFVVGATNVVANGGPGGAAAPAAGANVLRQGGALPAQSTSGDLNAAGETGGFGYSITTTTALSGCGGSSLFGGGGLATNANGNGAAAVNFGSGGAGALTVGAANATGGLGSIGVIIVDEFT